MSSELRVGCLVLAAVLGFIAFVLWSSYVDWRAAQ